MSRLFEIADQADFSLACRRPYARRNQARTLAVTSRTETSGEWRLFHK